MDKSQTERGSGELGVGQGRLFVHTEGGILQSFAPLDCALGDALRTLGLETSEDTCVFTGATIFRADPDVVEDDDGPVPIATLVREVTGPSGHCHVVVHRCRQVAVSVHYQSRTIERRVSPSRTIADVRAWAIRRLHLQDDAANDKLVLEICDSDRRPRPEVRLATLLGKACTLCFDLVPDQIIEG